MDPQATLLLARGPVIALSRTDALGPASSSQSPTGVRCFSVYGTTDKVVNHTENGMATHRTETAAHRRAARYLCLVEGRDLRGAVLRHAPPGRRGGSPVPDCLGRGVVPADRPEGLPNVAGRRTRAERPRLFPLYPLLVRGLHAVAGGSLDRAAVAVTIVASAAAMVVIWLLVERLTDTPTATRSVAFISFFPWAFIFSFAYSEGLLLLLAGICLLALLGERWLVAGVAAALAGAARPNGFVLALPCAWAAAGAIRRRRDWWGLAAPALAPIGVLAFFGYLQVRTGDFLANLHARSRGWAYDQYRLLSGQREGPVTSPCVTRITHQTSRSAGVGATFATLSGRIQRPRGCLEIEFLFDRAVRGQTAKGFSEPPENRTRWPRRRPSTPEVTTLREIQTVKPSSHYPRAYYVRKESNFSRATVR